MEPSWDEIRERLEAMTTKQLRAIARDWFSGCLGGATTKSAIAGEMATQLRHWWHLSDGYGRARVRNVLRDVGMGEGQ